MNKVRYDIIDEIKGMTILFVLIGHILVGIINNYNIDSPYTNDITIVENLCYVLKDIIYSFHMPLFFIISGIFANHSLKEDFKSMIKNKFFRLGIPYFFWSFVAAICMQIISKYTTNGLGIEDFILSPIHPFFQYWFLYDLFFIFIIYYVFNYIFNKKIFFVFCMILYLINYYLPDYWIIKSISTYLIFFSIGTFVLDLFKNIFIKRSSVKELVIIGGLFFLAIIYYINLLYTNKLDGFIYLYKFIVAILGSGCICVLISYMSNNKFVSIIIKLFGKESMLVYCIHVFFISATLKIILIIWGKIDILLMFFICLFISITFCLLVICNINKFSRLKIIFGEIKK